MFIDVMVNGRYYCSFPYQHFALLPFDEEDARKRAVELYPSLLKKNFTLAYDILDGSNDTKRRRPNAR